ncbi:MAG: hypothetical protein K0S23_190 [Fluviicola sp.]|jgi:hypothetical protein|nr:hypothetical protein [Fluviicola sp.]
MKTAGALFGYKKSGIAFTIPLEYVFNSSVSSIIPSTILDTFRLCISELLELTCTECVENDRKNKI